MARLIRLTINRGFFSIISFGCLCKIDLESR